MTKKLFLATASIRYKDDPPGTAHRQTCKDPHRNIHRIVAAEDELKATAMLETHIANYELVMDDEELQGTEAWEALGLS